MYGQEDTKDDAKNQALFSMAVGTSKMQSVSLITVLNLRGCDDVVHFVKEATVLTLDQTSRRSDVIT